MFSLFRSWRGCDLLLQVPALTSPFSPKLLLVRASYCGDRNESRVWGFEKILRSLPLWLLKSRGSQPSSQLCGILQGSGVLGATPIAKARMQIQKDVMLRVAVSKLKSACT